MDVPLKGYVVYVVMLTVSITYKSSDSHVTRYHMDKHSVLLLTRAV